MGKIRMGEMINTYNILIENFEENRPLLKPKYIP
jgi:hypothetical protein